MMTPSHATPREIRLNSETGALTLIWAEDDISSLNATLLRNACRCAGCRTARIHDDIAGDPGIKVVDARLFGVAGLQLVFSDGHERGIFPWRYLRELG